MNIDKVIENFRKDLTKDWTEKDWCEYEESCVKKKAIDNLIIDAILKAKKLDWIKIINGEPHIHIADLEKTILGIFDKSYIDNLLRLKQKEMKNEKNIKV